MLFAMAAPASAQFVVAPVGTVTQHYGYRYLTPYGVHYGQGFQTRPVWGVVGVVPPPPPPQPLVIIVQAPPAPLPAVQDPLAQARIDDKVKRGELLVVQPQKNDVRVAGGPDLLELPKPSDLEFPPDEPKARSKFLIEKARQAFLQDEQGRAAERLQAAIDLVPNAPLPYFLLAQVYVARGEYPEAVAAIRAGMRKHPDWPTARFDPTTMYSRPEFFDPDLQKLKTAAEAKPDDPALLFLYGYQLFFLGDRKEAAKLFKKAAARTKENAIIERFLLETMS
jgi:hypothetical protein